MVKKFNLDVNKVMRQAISEKANEVKDNLKVNLPCRSGDLRNSLHIQSTSDSEVDIKALDYGLQFKKQIEESV